MTVPSKKSVIGIGIFSLLLIASIPAAITWREAKAAADHSAHAALTAEIFDQLSGVSNGQPYPKSLSELRLTYPDGGDASLLRRFTYRSTGTNCTVSTRLGGEETLRSFP